MNNFKQLRNINNNNSQNPDKNFVYKIHRENSSTKLLLMAPEDFYSTNIHQASERSHNLWKSNCFEFFIKKKNSQQYREYNFSPNGHWQCYDFIDYRQGQVEVSVEVPKLSVSKEENLFSIEVNEGDYDLINVCVVYIHENTTHYYTLNPTSPADFHDQKTWLSFDNLMA